jgi:hypothetical protein
MKVKQIRKLKWLLEVDVDKTKDFYSKEIELCSCLYCENYIEACKRIDPSIMAVLTMLGIIPSKPSHLSEFGEMEDGLRLYIGSYHLVGNLIEGEYCRDSEWNDTNTASIKNFTFGFNKELLFAPDELQPPVLQLDFEARIPWVLNEKPED